MRRVEPGSDMLRRRKRRRRGRGPARGARPTARRAAKPARKPRRLDATRGSLVASLEQRHLDLIGLGLVAVGVYLACMLYAGWEGGPVGEWLEAGALATVAGRIAYAGPARAGGLGCRARHAALRAGARRAQRRRRSCCSPRCCSRSRPRRPGSARASGPPRLLRAALLQRPRRRGGRGPLLGGDHPLPAPRRPDPRRADVRQRRAAAHRDHRLGAALARRAGGANRGRRHARAGARPCASPGIEGARARAATRSRSRVRARPSRSRPRSSEADTGEIEADVDHEWEATTRRASRGRGAGGSRPVRLRGGDGGDEPSATSRASRRRPRPADELTPMGNKRSGRHRVRGDRLPAAARRSCSSAGKGDPGPDMRDREAVAEGAARGAAPLRRRREAARAWSAARTSAATSSSSRPGPRSPRWPSSATTWPTRWPRPTSASWPRFPARRRSGWRCPTSAGGWSASATSTTAARRAPRRSPSGSARTSPARRCGPTSR